MNDDDYKYGIVTGLLIAAAASVFLWHMIEADYRARIAAALDFDKIGRLVEAAKPFSLPDDDDESIAAFAEAYPEEGGYVVQLRTALADLQGATNGGRA